MNAAGRTAGVVRRFWRRTRAMLIKEFIQLRRDRVSFAMIMMIPLMQLVLFGYAINTTPRNLPTAVLLQETSDVGRSILEALKNTRYFTITHQVSRRGGIRPAARVGQGAVRRRDSARLRARAAARRPAGAAGRGGRDRSGGVGLRARRAERHCRRPRCRTSARCPRPGKPPFEIRTHARYNPAAVTSLNIVPGLVGTILTMTMLIFTALSVTREIERGTMESLLSMPITPLEIMLGKIIPYIIVGFVQATLIIGTGVLLFGVPILGSLTLLAALSTLFIATNLSIGYTLLDGRAEPAAGDADDDDVLPAEHPAVRLHVPVRRHAGLGAMDRRMRCRSRIISASCARSC